MGRRKGTSEAFVGPRMPIQCVHCAGLFSPSSARNVAYCTKLCKVSAWLARNPGRKAELQRPKSSCWFADYCSCCSIAYGDRSKANRRSTCASCARQLALATQRENAEAEHRARARVNTCPMCAADFCPLFGAYSRVVCDPCQQHIGRSTRSAHQEKRKAKIRGSRRAEPCGWIGICTRDKWTCQRCGIPTPRNKRGTHDADAPEVDHMFPCSKHGPHVRWNLRCLCRACNGTKADSMPTLDEAIAQMLRADASS